MAKAPGTTTTRTVLVLVAALAGCGRLRFAEVAPDAPSDGLVPDPTLVAWYPLDDDPATSSLYHDATGQGHTALCVATCPTRTAGRTAGTFALHFFAGGLVIAPDGLDLAPPFSIALWTKIDSEPSFFYNFIGRPYGASTEDSYALDILSPGVAEFFTPVQQHLEGATMLPIDAWVHIAATYDGTTKQLYVAGQLDGTMASTPPPYDSHPVYVAADVDAGSLAGQLEGSLADVRLYKRSLSADEIAALAAP